MTEPFVIEGDLWLLGQEGGFADNAFTLKTRDVVSPLESLLAAISNAHPGWLSLDGLVAEHFQVEREKNTGNWHIGQARITIEQVESNEHTD